MALALVLVEHDLGRARILPNDLAGFALPIPTIHSCTGATQQQFFGDPDHGPAASVFIGDRDGWSGRVGQQALGPRVKSAYPSIVIKPRQWDHLREFPRREQTPFLEHEGVRREQPVRAQHHAGETRSTDHLNDHGAAQPHPSGLGHDEIVDVGASFHVVHRQRTGQADHSNQREPTDDPCPAPGRGQ
jgi:hypothetical protein